jgi:tetratricopeptide (TPR) repeat protein
MAKLKRETFILGLIFIVFNLNGQDMEGFYKLGVKEMQSGDDAFAVYYFTKGIEVGNDNSSKGITFLAYIYHERGRCKFKLGDQLGSFSDFTKSIELTEDILKNNNYDSENIKLVSNMLSFNFYHRAKLNERKKDLKNALLDINNAINLNKNDSEYYIFRGILNLLLNQKKIACLDFSRAGDLGDGRAYEKIRENCN